MNEIRTGHGHEHRLHGELGWLTPAERFDGTPFTDRGFEHIPALEHLQRLAGRTHGRLISLKNRWNDS